MLLHIDVSVEQYTTLNIPLEKWNIGRVPKRGLGMSTISISKLAFGHQVTVWKDKFSLN